MKKSIVALLLGLAVIATSASAGVVLYDFAWANNGGLYQSAGDQPLAQTFTTGNDALTLDSVEIWLRSEIDAPQIYSLYLYATDSNKMPTGDSLYRIASNIEVEAWYDCPPGAGNGVDYAGINYALSANTTYAIVLNSGWGLSWKYNDIGSPTSDIAPTPTFYNWELKQDEWQDADPEAAFSMKIVAIPEPAAVTTTILTALAALFIHRRCRATLPRR